MLEKDRRSIFSRVTAIGFIVVLIFGNIWFVDALLAVAPPSWVLDGFWVGVGIVFLGGMGLLLQAARQLWRK